MKGSFGMILPLVVLCLAFPTLSQGTPADNPALEPMYGGVEKTESQKKADEAFIAEVVQLVGSREKGSEAFVEKGFQAFFQSRDPKTAMLRFNQAWLLNPENPRVVWGFGVVLGALGKLDESVKFLTFAAGKAGDNAKILTDLGYSLMLQGLESADPAFRKENLKKAVEAFQKAEKIDSAFEPLFSNWAAALFYAEDYSGAWGKVEAAQKLGGKTLDPRFLKELEGRMPRPGAR